MTNGCLPCQLRRAYAVLWATVLLARRHLNTMLLTNFENLNSISNIFQKTHNFLVLTDPVIISIYSRTIDRHFCDQGSVCHPTSKLLKCDLVQTLNTFRNPSLRTFLSGRHLLFFIWVCLVKNPGNKAKSKNLFLARFYDCAIWCYSVFLRACFSHSKGMTLH